MRVLLVNEASGVHTYLKRGLEALGHEAVLVMPQERTYQGRSADIYFDWRRERLVPKVRGKLKDFGPPTWSLRKLPTADVVNFMNVMSLFIRGPNRYRDLPLLQRSGSSLSYYGVGCDEVSLMRVRPDAAELPCASCEALDALGQQCRERILGLREAARAASDHVEFVVSSAYEYSHCHEFFEGGSHAAIPLPIDLSGIEFVGALPAKEKALVIHAPTRRGFKGTHQVLEAVNLLREDGTDFDFELIEGVSHAEFLRTLARADVVVDQVLTQSYGMSALECLAMGKVVLSGMGTRAQRYFPFAAECPIVDAPSDVKRLAEAIRNTLARREEFEVLGGQGRSYVAQHHDHVAIARQFADFWTG